MITRGTETGREVPDRSSDLTRPNYHVANKEQNQNGLQVLIQVLALGSKNGVAAMAHSRSQWHKPHLVNQAKEVIHMLSADV